MRHVPLILQWGMVILLVVGSGCLGVQVGSDDTGRTRVYESGQPVFDLETSVHWDDDTPQVESYLGIPRTSLSFVQDGSTYVAVYEAALRVYREDGESGAAAHVSFTDTVQVTDYEATQSYRSIHRRRRLAVPPGDYRVEATVTDQNSDESVTRRQDVRVPAKNEGPAMSRLHVQARRGESGFEPVLSFHVPGGLDSLRASVSLHHLRSVDTMQVEMHLLQYPRDTTAARPLHWLMPTRGSLRYRGVRYDEADTLQRTRRALRRPASHVDVTFSLPRLQAGIYRVVVEARGPDVDTGTLLQQERTLSVRSPYFPRVETVRQMVHALTYLASEEELDHMLAAESPAEMRRRFDAFWGKLIPERQRAADVIRRYYNRVETANRRYTNYKAGWKTDRGMMYILLGEPLYKERNANSVVWYYSYNERSQLDTFSFREVRMFGIGRAFEHYMLQRQSYYERVWRDALQKWREGEVL